MIKTIRNVGLWAVALLCLISSSAHAQSIELTMGSQPSWEAVDNEIPGFYNTSDVLAMDGDVLYALYKGADNQTRVKRYAPNGTGFRKWEQVGGIVAGDLTNQSLSIAAANGRVYVAFKDASAGNRLTVKQLDAASPANDWEIVGSAGISLVASPYNIKMVLNAGVPYIVCQDNADNNLTSVLKYNGMAWERLGAKGLGLASGAHNASLAFVDDIPHIIFKNGDNFLKATVMAYHNGAGTWSLVGGSTVSPGFAQAVSLAAIGTQLFAAYTEGASSAVTVKALNAGAWQTISTNAGTATGAHLNLKSFGENLFLEFSDGTAAKNITVKRHNGTGWSNISSTTIPSGDVADVSVALTNSSAFVCFKKNNAAAFNSLYKLEYNLGSFGAVITGTASAAKTLEVITQKSNGTVKITAPAGFEVATSTSGYLNSVITATTDGIAKTVSVRAKPSVSGVISGYLTFSTNGAATERVFVSANGYKEPTTITATTADAPVWESMASNVQGFSNMSGVLALDGDILYQAYKTPDSKSKIRRYAMDAAGTRRWSEVNAALPADLTYTGLKMAAKGNMLYAAYPDLALGNKLTVKKIDPTDAGATWEAVGAAGITASGVTVYDVVLHGDAPYVLLQENSKVSLMKYNGTTWEYVGAKDLGQTANTHNPSVVFVNAVPYIVYKDGGNSLKATVRGYNSTTNTWDLVGSSTVSPGFAQIAAIAAIDSKLYVAYTDGYTATVKVKYLNGDNWEDVGTSPGIATGGHLTLAATGTNLNVLFTESESKLTLKQLKGTTWELVGGTSIASGNIVWPDEVATAFYGNTVYVAHATGAATGQYNLYKLSDLYLPDFGDALLGKATNYQVFHVSAKNLTGLLQVNASEGYLVSDQASASFTSSFGLGGSSAYNIQVHVKFKPSQVGQKPGYITVSSDGAAPVKVLVSGSGIYPMELSTPAVSDVTASGATFKASVITDRGSAITEKGFVYSTSSNPKVGEGHKVQSGAALEATASALAPNRTYYVRAYAISSNGTGYSDEATFTTPKGQATITLSGLSQFYNGETRNASVSTSPAGLTVNLTYKKDGVALAEAPVNAGTYTVTADIADGQDYTGTKTETFTIQKSIAAIDFGNTFRVYDGSEKQIVPATTPANLNVTLVYKKDGVVMTALPVNAGNYTVEATVVDDNYTATKTGTFTILKAAQTVTFDEGVAYEHRYNALFNPGATATSGKAVTYTITEGATFAEVTAENKIRVIGLGIFKVEARQAGDENHEAATAVRQFKSAKATRFVSFEDQQTVYNPAGYQLQPATSSPEGAITYEVYEQETAQYPGKVSIEGSLVTVLKAGKVKLRALVADDMYGTDAFDEMELTVTKAAASIGISGLEQQYDGTAKQVAVTTTPGGILYTVTYNGSESAPSQAGTYAVLVTVQSDVYEGELAANFTIVGPTAVKNPENQPKLAFYPNPTDRYLYLETEARATIEVISVTGQVLMRQQASEGHTTLDLTGLGAGYYILKVSTRHGQLQKKFVKR